MHTSMFDSFVTGHWFNASAKRIWSDVSTLQFWLRVEEALAKAQGELNVIPASAALTIASKADAGLFDIDRLARDIAHAQHPLVPVLHQFEALCGNPAAGFIHWGATTQNIFDTASSLQMIATHRVLMAQLNDAVSALSTLALEHRQTAMPGRTHGQHALPMTFGFKLAGWVDELSRNRDRLDSRLSASFPASMGGAIGTFAATGAVGRQVEARMAEQLGLVPAGLPMRASYDRVSDYVNTLGLLAGTAQKIAQDIVFMQRTEVGEVAEAFHMGKVGSSTMAQKRNPSTALLLSSLARMLRARVPMALESMVRMDEGDSSVTNVTDTLLPEIAIIATSVAETLAKLAQGLAVDATAMARNLGLTNGLIASEAAMMRLTQQMGRHEAHRLLYEAAQRTHANGTPFQEAIQAVATDLGLSLPHDFLSALDPSGYLGESASLTQDTIGRVSAAR